MATANANSPQSDAKKSETGMPMKLDIGPGNMKTLISKSASATSATQQNARTARQVEESSRAWLSAITAFGSLGSKPQKWQGLSGAVRLEHWAQIISS